jgi:hypothetical protein
MKTIKTILSAVSLAAVAVAFSACGNSSNAPANNAANSSNAANKIIVTNANSANANNTNAANTNLPAKTDAPTADDARFKGEYMVGDVKCTVKPDGRDLIHEIKCAGKEKVQIYSRDDAPPKAVIVSENQKSRFVFDDPANLANGNFTDETGKSVKVVRVK